MTEELSKQYNPKETEEKWYKTWEENNLFSAKVSPEKSAYCIVIPPPNVTGILHMGHALNNTIQDILIRYKRMKGFSSLWMPGTDHAGIATQNVVERSLAKEGLKRQDLGSEKFIAKVWDWKEQYGSTIIRQLKKLGASCDWSRERFTMDEEYSKAVRNAFVSLWSKKPTGLIYQDDKIINWCPRCQTALSDEEAPHKELQGNLYYLKYPLKDSINEFVIVATTRPETMLGDTAVAVNPKDKRYKKLIGKTLILPLVNREIKIIADNLVDMNFGTGAVKVTPAHDPNDFALSARHRLQLINVMYPDGKMNENSGDYKDMDRFEAREVILEDLKERELLEKVEPHPLSAGHCYRCHTIIEPYLSKQWFVKMKSLAKPAIEAVKKGKIKFYPPRWKKVYLNWMENIQDWCISRQIWWGHQIPVWYCSDCKKNIMASVETPLKCTKCGSTKIYQDKDVLDTWFSSWLWPFATFKNKVDLQYFYPTSTLVTAPEIIFFWVARMIMAGLEFQGQIPFKDVYIHGTVRDIEGKKMSKSLGNIIDPLEIIKEYGADALRFSLISTTAQGQDVYLSKDRFEQGRNFANKIWNASRFILMNLKAENVNADLCVFFKNEKLDIANRWILSRFYSTLKKTEEDLAVYRFNEAANNLYSFFWHEFCDWYLELIKPQIDQKQTQLIMYKVLEKFLRAIHPFMPFISEEIWQRLPGAKGSIMQQSWPHLQKNLISNSDEKQMQLAFDIINTIRNMRAQMEIGLASQIEIKLTFCDKSVEKTISSLISHIKNLAKVGNLTITEIYQPQKNEFVCALKDLNIVMPLSGIVNVAEQIEKNQAKIDKIKSEIKNKEGMLANKNFLSRAPKEIIDAERTKLKDMYEQVDKLEVIKNGLR
ncbi:MAG: valine--tRNA ligase [Candidatus Omnitrophica bacterium]|nr:valine--tRNA ligase [Candidatus Omnitrophota bacterium]MBU1923759.1 valine--tRNA ligase [Candidatus Omnitrophota bacterium]